MRNLSQLVVHIWSRNTDVSCNVIISVSSRGFVVCARPFSKNAEWSSIKFGIGIRRLKFHILLSSL
jgi:hypothetical protein